MNWGLHSADGKVSASIPSAGAFPTEGMVIRLINLTTEKVVRVKSWKITAYQNLLGGFAPLVVDIDVDLLEEHPRRREE